MTDTPTNDLPRNEFERRASELADNVWSFIRGNIDAEAALGALVSHYETEVLRRQLDLRHEIKREEHLCDNCPGKHLKDKKNDGSDRTDPAEMAEDSEGGEGTDGDPGPEAQSKNT